MHFFRGYTPEHGIELLSPCIGVSPTETFNSRAFGALLLVCLVPGLSPERSILILAGTTTYGTQGAVEFVSRPDSVEQLLKQLPGAGSGPIKPFEALVHVKIARGVSVETELVAARSR